MRGCRMWVGLCIPHRTFNRDLWYSQIEYRYELSDYIIESWMLMGKTKEEVKGMKGDEKNQYDKDVWTYYLGFVPSIGGIAPDILVVEFINGVVVKVS
ncbi:hypothetical protein K1X76_11615 [bacterium]|nr:hypothetical protein [bacterium]